MTSSFISSAHSWTETVRARYWREQFDPTWLGTFLNYKFLGQREIGRSLRKYANTLSGRLLDFGCGQKPYAHIFAHVDEYIGLDTYNSGHPQEHYADVYYDGWDIPFPDNHFDSILSTEVFEHVPDLDHSLSELNRVLRTGGYLLATVPRLWPEHEEPFDFRRLTEYGMIRYLENARFRIVHLERRGSFIDAITQMIQIYTFEHLLPSGFYAKRIAGLFTTSILNILGLTAEILLPTRKDLYLKTVVLAEALPKR